METGLNRVCARYGKIEPDCVNGLSFAVAQRGITALLGESGSGKTSVLRLFAGFLRPVSGSVIVEGQTVSSERNFVRPEERRVGVLFQDYALFPHLNVAENILFGAPGDLGAAARRELLHSLLEACRLAHLNLAGRRPHELSGGQMQRVALARVLASRPRLLILDEPFNSVDLELREQMLSHVKALVSEYSMRLLYITHDRNEAFYLADELAIIRRGALLQQGSAADLYERPANAYVAAYFDKANILALEPSGAAAKKDRMAIFRSAAGPIRREWLHTAAQNHLANCCENRTETASLCLRAHELIFCPLSERRKQGALARVVEQRYYGSHRETWCASEEPEFAGTKLVVRSEVRSAALRKGEQICIAPSLAARPFHVV